MKILLNVARDGLEVDVWIECQGVKLSECADGSFDLILTTDIERMRKSDRAMADVLARMRKQAT